MAIHQKPLMTAAFAKGTTWGTAVDCDISNAKLALYDETLAKETQRFPNLAAMGSTLQVKQEQGIESHAGTISLPFDFHADLLIAYFMGTSATPSQVAATTAYTNTLSLKDNLQSIFATLCIEKDVDLFEYDSVKLEAMRIIGVVGELWRLEFDVVARAELLDGSTPLGATNTVITSATYLVDPPVLMPWKDSKTKVRIADQSAGSLGSGDVIYPSEFRLEFRRPMRRIFTSQNAPYTSEPVQNGFTEITGSFTLPLFDAIGYIEDQNAGTLKKLDLTLDGEADSIESGQDYQMLFNIPQAQITGAPSNASGPETAQHQISFVVTEASSNPTGMTDTAPYITLKNTRTASPLA